MSASDRHAGDAGGVLGAWERRRLRPVHVRVSAIHASLPAAQLTGWLLVGLLARMQGVVERVTVECPAGVALLPRVCPLAPATTLDEALVGGGAAIGVVPVTAGPAAEGAIVLAVGPGPAPAGGTRVFGDGWTGGFGRCAMGAGMGSALPFGPCAAACLAAGQVFLAARAPELDGASLDPRCVSLWSCRVGGPELFGDGPVAVDVTLDAGLAGVGAVGCALLALLWSCPGVGGRVLAADADAKGIEESNLNRCLLFVAASVGAMKATEAARVLAGGELTVEPFVGRYETAGVRPRLLLSAVDTNRAREALQSLYVPRVISASTEALRAEVLRCGPPGRGACLRCFNEPETFTADTTLRARLLTATDAELADVAAAAGVGIEEVRAALARGDCGTVDAAAMQYARARHDASAEEPAEFSVSFVSAMAGAMLAAETVKLHLAAPLAHGDAQRFATQFVAPTSAVNRARFLGRDAACPACAGSVAADAWARRYASWAPGPACPR